ncbi:MAG TPA: SPASM domain-containing protein, partial [Phycisphaerae bacterium]|nr:SPASM domain-containing protein [Phycisphaerae bacterium]
EDFHPQLLQALAEKNGADAVATIPAAAPLFDPVMLDAMIDHARRADEPTGITFLQAPPGLGAFIIRRHILDQLAGSTIPPGAILNYQPTNPMADLTGRDTCYRPSVEVIQSRGRLLCDTHRSMRRMHRLFAAGGADWNSLRIARWLNDVDAGFVEDAPAEIEIELTTNLPDSWHSLLRPLGGRHPGRDCVSMETVAAVAASIGAFDDVQVVLGGFGDPIMHPDFAGICRAFRAAGAAAVAVRTTGALSDERVESALFETPVDLVEVMLDAASPETYRRVWGMDGYDQVMSIFENRLARRVRENRVLPLWMPSLVKANETFDDLDPFVDAWQRRLGMYLVSGYGHCCGQREPRAITSMAPPARTPCRRVGSRMVVLADGAVTTCDQDFCGLQLIGNVLKTPLRELWRNSQALASIRQTVVGDAPLCAKCDEWHRA